MTDMGTSKSTLAAPSSGEQAAEQVRAVLVAARKLIEKPENWCQEEYHSSSGQFCAYGALIEIYHSGKAAACDEAETLLRGAMDGRYVEEFNDAEGRTHAEVLAAFDKAIASLNHSDDRVQDGDKAGEPETK